MTKPKPEDNLLKYISEEKQAHRHELFTLLDINIRELQREYPLALYEARKIYPEIELDDLDVVLRSLSLSLEFIGDLDLRTFLDKSPTIFLFCAYCSWFHYYTQVEYDPYHKQRHYYTVLSALLGVGHTLEECKVLLNDLQLSTGVRRQVFEDISSTYEKGLVVYSFNPAIQSAVIH